MTFTLHKSQVDCSCVIPVMSLQFTHLPAEAGCETCERIVLLLVFIA